MEWLFLILLILMAILAYLWATYNGLIRKKGYVSEAWAQIDVQLKRKANILTNLVDTVKMMSAQESEVLIKIAELRNLLRSNDKANNMKGDQLTMPVVLSLQETYPQLKTNDAYLKIMEEVKDCEAKIAYARTRYNNMVMVYNNALQQFPTVFFARMLNMQPEQSYEISSVERDYADHLRINEL